MSVEAESLHQPIVEVRSCEQRKVVRLMDHLAIFLAHDLTTQLIETGLVELADRPHGETLGAFHHHHPTGAQSSEKQLVNPPHPRPELAGTAVEPIALPTVADPALDITPQAARMAVADGMSWQFEHRRLRAGDHERGHSGPHRGYIGRYHGRFIVGAPPFSVTRRIPETVHGTERKAGVCGRIGGMKMGNTKGSAGERRRWGAFFSSVAGIGMALIGAVGEAAAAPACASPAEVEAVKVAMAGKEPGPLGAVAAAVKLPESVVASALPAGAAHGVAAEHFPKIWKSLETWTDAVTFIVKGRDLFEVKGPVGKGEPSTRSKFFNLSREGDGLMGHLRPDLYSAIYVLSVTGETSTLRGVTFFDPAGDAVFSVFVPGEGGEPPPPTVVEQFEATAAMMRALPSLCPR